MFKNLCAATAAAVLCLFQSSVLLSVATPARAQAQPLEPPSPPLKIAFVYVSPVTPAGWTRQHDDARRAVALNLGAKVQTSFVENVPEGPDAERVIRDLAQQGHGLIITPSFGFMEPTMRVAKDFPNVKFESITGFKTATNVSTANARYYEGRYLAGIAAGRVSANLGYVAGFPIPEVLQGINAFTLGARSVNPKAQVRLVWLNEWFNPPKEREAAMSLMNQGVDVLAFHTGSAAVMTAAQERGKFAIGYHSDMRAFGPQAQLLAVTHHWEQYYTQRAQAVLDGKWTSAQVWGGLATGMVNVDHFGARLSASAKAEVLLAKKRIASGKLKPFSGGKRGVRSSNGEWAIEPGQELVDEQISKMNWLVDGVIGAIK